VGYGSLIAHYDLAMPMPAKLSIVGKKYKRYETIDFYRYFDATKQAEFLYDCVDDTIRNIIPEQLPENTLVEQLQLLEYKYISIDNGCKDLFQYRFIMNEVPHDVALSVWSHP